MDAVIFIPSTTDASLCDVEMPEMQMIIMPLQIPMVNMKIILANTAHPNSFLGIQILMMPKEEDDTTEAILKENSAEPEEDAKRKDEGAKYGNTDGDCEDHISIRDDHFETKKITMIQTKPVIRSEHNISFNVSRFSILEYPT